MHLPTTHHINHYGQLSHVKKRWLIPRSSFPLCCSRPLFDPRHSVKFASGCLTKSCIASDTPHQKQKKLVQPNATTHQAQHLQTNSETDTALFVSAVLQSTSVPLSIRYGCVAIDIPVKNARIRYTAPKEMVDQPNATSQTLIQDPRSNTTIERCGGCTLAHACDAQCQAQFDDLNNVGNYPKRIDKSPNSLSKQIKHVNNQQDAGGRLIMHWICTCVLFSSELVWKSVLGSTSLDTSSFWVGINIFSASYSDRRYSDRVSYLFLGSDVQIQCNCFENRGGKVSTLLCQWVCWWMHNCIRNYTMAIFLLALNDSNSCCILVF